MKVEQVLAATIVLVAAGIVAFGYRKPTACPAPKPPVVAKLPAPTKAEPKPIPVVVATPVAVSVPAAAPLPIAKCGPGCTCLPPCGCERGGECLQATFTQPTVTIAPKAVEYVSVRQPYTYTYRGRLGFRRTGTSYRNVTMTRDAYEASRSQPKQTYYYGGGCANGRCR